MGTPLLPGRPTLAAAASAVAAPAAWTADGAVARGWAEEDEYAGEGGEEDDAGSEVLSPGERRDRLGPLRSETVTLGQRGGSVTDAALPCAGLGGGEERGSGEDYDEEDAPDARGGGGAAADLFRGIVGQPVRGGGGAAQAAAALASPLPAPAALTGTRQAGSLVPGTLYTISSQTLPARRR